MLALSISNDTPREQLQLAANRGCVQLTTQGCTYTQYPTFADNLALVILMNGPIKYSLTSDVPDSEREMDDSEPLSDTDSDSEFDDQDGEELFDMFTGEVAETQSEEDSLATLDPPGGLSTQQWHWIPLRGSTDIRLIDIDTDGSSDIVRCRMRTTSLEEPCEYYTLSYTWGESKDDGSHFTHVIYCDDVAFRITKNLHDALSRMRTLWAADSRHSVRKPLTLWCDAICINQGNDFERSGQVMLMDKIYKSSTHLLIWLGAEVETPVDILFDMAADNADKVPSWVTVSLVTQVLRESPWFRRRWVIQEVASQPTSSSSILGTKGLLSVQPTRVWIEYVECGEHTHVDDVKSTYLTQRRYHGNPMHQRTSYPLILNLYWYRDARCSDDRDRIYALRSVSSDAEELIADYTKSTAEVYCTVAALSAKRGLVVPVLMLAELGRSRASDDRPSLGMSSWIPDWREWQHERSYLADDHKALLNVLDQWAEHPDLIEIGPAGACHVFRESTDEPNFWRLAISGWLFEGCQCAIAMSALSEDCLQCLLGRYPMAEHALLRSLRHETVLVLDYSQTLIVLKPCGHGMYELIRCMRISRKLDVPEIIRKYPITASGSVRKLEEVILI